MEHSLIKMKILEPTFHHSNGVSSSNIDFFLISENITASITDIVSQCNLRHPQNFSCHDPLSASLCVLSPEIPKRKEQYTHTYTKFEQARIIWNEEKIKDYQKLAGQVLADFEAFFPTPEFTPLKCQLYSDLLVKSAELTMDTKPVQSASKIRPSPQIHHAWTHLRKYFNIWKNAGRPRDPDNCIYLEYKQSRANFQRVRRHQHNLRTIKLNNKIMQTNKTDRNRFFKLMKNLRAQPARRALQELQTPVGVYYGRDTLEGFAMDAEILGRHVGESNEYDNEFYRLCKQDNQFIFDMKSDSSMKIPKMKIVDLENIVNKEMQNGKACDIYKLTAEHLKNCGSEAKLKILNLINSVIEEMYYLSCPQIKAGLGTAVLKGKKKPVSASSSYRRITVTPQIGAIIDRYIDPIAEATFRPVQSSEQYGFTQNVTYLMAAVLRGECQRWALDKKETCYGVSFDGKAAFPSVDRDIQVRELYSCGEKGDLLLYSRYTYENTVCRMKLGGYLSREIREWKGARQGHKRASGHFKTYINPCLTTANSSGLGFNIGPICISAVCVADDTYILSGDPRSLQGLIDIVGHYGKRYRLIFGADKTRVIVTGSKHDIQYYSEISFWSLYGDKIEVSENNNHLGMIVSGIDEEQKNVDKNIGAARNALFSFLGNIFSYKCKISTTVQYHTWLIYVKPVLRSGLAALPVRTAVAKSLTKFHLKVLRSILKLSPFSPIAPLYFLLGEPPLEATLHLDILSLFWNIWSNPNTKTFEVVKYLLAMADKNSLTWSAHVRILFQLYNLPDPLTLLDTSPWSKECWKSHITAVVISHHEANWRNRAAANIKLRYLNIQTIGLTTRPHPVLSWAETTQDVVILRPHIKMLAGDYQCYEYLAHDRGIQPYCRLCLSSTSPSQQPPTEGIDHILTQCRATSDTRASHLPGLLNTIAKYIANHSLLADSSSIQLSQFLLDCSSLNLPNGFRIPPHLPGFATITKQCSVMIFAIHKERTRQLKASGLIAN